METSTIIALDLACIAWVVFVLSNPWDRLVGMLKACIALASAALFAFPIVVGIVTAINGGDNVFYVVASTYVTELVFVLIALGSFLSIRGIWSLVRGVWFLFAASIAFPGVFLMASVVWLTW